MPAAVPESEESEWSSEDSQEDHPCIAWCGQSKTIPVFLFFPEAIISKNDNICCLGEQYHMAFKIVRTQSRLVRRILTSHGFHEVHPNSNDFNLMWTGSHLKPYLMRSLQHFQKVNHFPRSYEVTRKDRLYKNIQRMQEAHGFKNFDIVPQTFVLPSEYQEFCNCFAKEKGSWIIKPVASSRGRGIYLVNSPTQISLAENILVSRYVNNPLLIDDFKFDLRLYVLVTSYDPLLIYVYEEGLARFATVKYDKTSKNIKNMFMHLTNYSVNKKSSDYISCDDPEVEDYGNKWSMSAVLRYLKQEGKDTLLLMRQVEDLIIKALLSAEIQISTACKTFVPHKTSCFELYGFDVLIDSTLKPWLLEVNLSPSLACDAPLDLKIKASMIADMFSLVGLVCQNPLSRQSRADRMMLDLSLKHPPQKVQRQKRQSARNAETEGLKDKQEAKHGQGDSSLSLTAEEVKVLRRIKEEYDRCGGFIRIFPTPETWEIYGGYLESKTSMNYTLANRLFHGRSFRNPSEKVQLQVEAVHGCHVVQYERKLASLETRVKRQRHRGNRSAGVMDKSGKQSKASSTDSNDQEGEEWDQEEREELKQELKLSSLHRQHLESISPKDLAAAQSKEGDTPPGFFRSDGLWCCGAADRNAEPRINLLHVLQQGWELSKVQARMAFSSYLQLVQQRLLAESKSSSIPTWPCMDSEKMELVMRFLKRAASDLQLDIEVVFPCRQLPLQERRSILSQHLGEFIHCYTKETDHMLKKQENPEEEHCVNPSMFKEYIAAASEKDLEEILTFYTQKNKSATIMGTKVKTVKEDSDEINAPREKVKSQPAAREGSNASESSCCTSKILNGPDGKVCESRLSVCAVPEDQQPAVTSGKPQPEVQASQHCSSFPRTLDCTHIHLQHSSPSPTTLHVQFTPPPLLSGPPSYAQSQSQFCRSEMHSDPPAYTSATMPTQPQKVPWTAVSTVPTTVSVTKPTQSLRRIQSFTLSTSSFRADSSFPSATQIYSQKLSRPTPDGQTIKRSSSGMLKSKSVEAFKDLNALSTQAPSDQRAFISALQKLANKQAAHHSSSCSHITLLTEHLTNLNLANKALSREDFTLDAKVRHAAVVPQGPVKAVYSGTDLCSSPSHKPPNDDKTYWDRHMQTGYHTANPKQCYEPSHGTKQLQFAIQQMQQQKLQIPQLKDQTHYQQEADICRQFSPWNCVQ
ncbi:tubulin polyglutamylase TTLL5 isoform X2 [Thalassophryne amazonica]|uniref:tubulin polyglutamylase TTLL5 isoform X2 n=1 Tax=Thalassophryne amazonica TaxID=390379 RepID=UPI0014719C64|nr:tubulin polyglutamylase TTLL5 isoform X2 [Thalassophryne amazonica]XP_034051482.1 tubulin polyglutamylase TTLL5 isoform X2 [Thalassophryne amazonica]